jgi:hypothetical protein
MELAPRYCRSCGSRILVKNICHNCNSEPLKGENYCYDCGALTPNPDSCLKCGARYKVKSPVKLLLILGGLLIIGIAVAGYFISRPDKPVVMSQQETTTADRPAAPASNTQELTQARDTIVNNPPVDTSALINTPVPAKPADTTAAKTSKPADTVKKTEPNVFSLEERKGYPVRCSYFTKNQRGRVLFFIAGGSGYIKMNEQIVELKRKRKGVDVAVFGNGQYEATLTIDGLSGNAKEWLAACTLIIKDLSQNTTLRHKVYSSCIEL